jgi:hypothetical protein
VPSAASKTAGEEKGFTLTESYEGSGNTDGFITDINSTVGYIFNPHFSINMGVQCLFVSPSTSKTGATSASGMGNPSLGFRYSRKEPLFDFSTGLNGAFPVARSAEGLSTRERSGATADVCVLLVSSRPAEADRERPHIIQTAPSFSHGKPLSQFAFIRPSGRHRYIVSMLCRRRARARQLNPPGRA